MAWDGSSLPYRAAITTITTGAANVAVSQAVTFDPPFPSGVVPVITLSVRWTVPERHHTSYSAPSSTGFTIWLVRDTSSADVDVAWRAEVPTQ